jgi:hypothetical protein
VCRIPKIKASTSTIHHNYEIITNISISSTHSKDLEDLSTTVIKIIEDDPHS